MADTEYETRESVTGTSKSSGLPDMKNTDDIEFEEF